MCHVTKNQVVFCHSENKDAALAYDFRITSRANKIHDIQAVH